MAAIGMASGSIALVPFLGFAFHCLWPARTQARNNNQRRSLTDLIIWSRAPISIKYRLQSYPSLLRAVLRSAYLVVLCSLALLASVSQGQDNLTKAILFLPRTDLSMMTRSGLCACTMTSTGMDPPPGACSPSKSQYSSTILLPTSADFRQPVM
jgi:hypothetical protein